jgi:hypothetical protein
LNVGIERTHHHISFLAQPTMRPRLRHASVIRRGGFRHIVGE